ncbi:Pyridoxal phosphate phosphatase [Phytophthora palmivora]|uniref:Pyridoxal phosphate phosphatase n=1 Tax=Phytophthora palmivora TaxID=4796 RepID=A0A2P4X575_9STRA|nr:Pyridoxal phosphate phosphatase [Phytophthora palmivora]
MDQFLVQLAKKCPQVSCVDIRNAAQRLPYNHHMVDAIRLAVDDFGATCKIVSDSTVFGVQSFVQHVGLADRVSEVVANPTHFENGGKVLRVRPYQGDHVAPHKCARCPKNLCKGAVVERILQQHRYSRVLFVGEGVGDFCAATKLARDDVVFARSSNDLLQLLLDASYDRIQTHVRQWKTGDDLLASFRSFFQVHRQKVAVDTSVEKDTIEIPHPISQGSGQVLVVFDFDESLVNKDSDTFAFQCFYPELIGTINERYAQNPVWPNVFDDMLQILVEERPEVTPELICERLARIPIQERMVDAVRMAVEQFGAEIKIISDGNSLFIDSVLKYQGLEPYINEVFTNPADHAVMGNGRTRIRLRPYHSDNLHPIECPWCPSNLCKGSILDSIRAAKPYSRVFYVGDGIGDFCPASRLTKNDVVFARADETNGRSFGLQKRIDSNPTLVEASVVPWSTGDDIYRHFAQVFHASPPSR